MEDSKILQAGAMAGAAFQIQTRPIHRILMVDDRDLAFGIAHRIAMLDEGRIVAIGIPDEIKHNPDSSEQHFLSASIAHTKLVGAQNGAIIDAAAKTQAFHSSSGN